MAMEYWGADALVVRLREISYSASRAVEGDILKAAASLILEDAKSRLERHRRTGKLEGALAIFSGRRDASGRSEIKVGLPRNRGVAYGIPLEWGHINRDGTVTPPYPYLYPAYESKKSEAYALIRDGLKAAILKGGGGE